jgi:hypothetical protein
MSHNYLTSRDTYDYARARRRRQASAFFAAGKGENLLRFCYSKKDAELAEACRRLRARA